MDRRKKEEAMEGKSFSFACDFGGGGVGGFAH